MRILCFSGFFPESGFFCKRSSLLSLYNNGYATGRSSELCTVWSCWNEMVSKENFKALIDDYSAQVLNTAVRILGDPEKARDVHQEVFLAIWKRWHKYNGRTNWNAYLYRATVRKAIELAKRSKAEQSVWERREHNACEERPDRSLRTSELQQKLAGCLAKLPKRQAEVFVLSQREGFRASRIAEVLGCSQKTVRVHLHRALKRLARELGDDLVAWYR